MIMFVIGEKGESVRILNDGKMIYVNYKDLTLKPFTKALQTQASLLF